MDVSCQLALALSKILYLYSIVLIVYAVLSWVPSLRGTWSVYVERMVEPVLSPVRRVIPPVGGLDLSFLIVLIGIQFLSNSIPQFVCYRY
jgi:YggT family protein